MAAKRRKPKGSNETVAQAVAHPLRIEALSILTERAASPKELAAELGLPVGNISYHVRELEREMELHLPGIPDRLRDRGSDSDRHSDRVTAG